MGDLLSGEVPLPGWAGSGPSEPWVSFRRGLVTKIGYYVGVRPPLPPWATRISVLTPSGIHLGQGPVEVLAEDPLGSGVITAGAALMEQLIEVAG
ncbi:MAG: hypothetical protein SGJ01_01295 [Gemmatimonadota bacterium]|nr:hypothetical protein [Gemmatimonadota bacterium]